MSQDENLNLQDWRQEEMVNIYIHIKDCGLFPPLNFFKRKKKSKIDKINCTQIAKGKT